MANPVVREAINLSKAPAGSVVDSRYNCESSTSIKNFIIVNLQRGYKFFHAPKVLKLAEPVLTLPTGAVDPRYNCESSLVR